MTVPPEAFGDSSVGVHDLNPKLPASRGGLKRTREAMGWGSLSPFMDSSYRLQKLPLKPSSFSLGRCVLSPRCRTLSTLAGHTGSILTGQLVPLCPGQKGLTGAEEETWSHTSERWKCGDTGWAGAGIAEVDTVGPSQGPPLPLHSRESVQRRPKEGLSSLHLWVSQSPQDQPLS